MPQYGHRSILIGIGTPHSGQITVGSLFGLISFGLATIVFFELLAIGHWPLAELKLGIIYFNVAKLLVIARAFRLVAISLFFIKIQ